MGKFSGPKPPDPYQTADAQAQANILAARETAKLNQFNQVGPEGSVQFSGTPGGADRLRTVTLSPGEQQKYDLSNQLAIALSGEAVRRSGDLPGQAPITTAGLPERIYGVGETPLDLRQFGVPDTASGLTLASQGVQRSLGPINSSGIASAFNANPVLTGETDFSADRNRVEQQLYGRDKERLDQHFNQQRERLHTQLVNQGLPVGSEAYNDAMESLGREATDAYGAAQARAVAAGGGEQSRLFGLAQSTGAQQLQTLGALGGFANKAQQKAFGQAGGIADARLRELAAAISGQQAYNAAATDQQALGLQAAGFSNQQRGTQLQEDLTVRNQLINELSALIQGAPAIASPTPAGGLGINVGAAPIADLINQNYQQRSARSGATLGALGGLLGTAIGFI